MAFSSQGHGNQGGGGLYRPLADINVTPLVDVMLVLLIIFMVTAPMLATGMKVNLPQAKQAQPLDPKDPVIITVAKDGKLSLGNDEIEKDRLIDAVRAKLDGDLTRTIHLRGDKEVAYGDVVAIMDLLATNGLTHIAIVADARAKPDAPAKPAVPDATPAQPAAAFPAASHVTTPPAAPPAPAPAAARAAPK
jgi:TolR protein